MRRLLRVAGWIVLALVIAIAVAFAWFSRPVSATEFPSHPAPLATYDAALARIAATSAEESRLPLQSVGHSIALPLVPPVFIAPASSPFFLAEALVPERLLRKDPAGRFQSGGHLCSGCQHLLAQGKRKGDSATQPSRGGRRAGGRPGR